MMMVENGVTDSSHLNADGFISDLEGWDRKVAENLAQLNDIVFHYFSFPNFNLLMASSSSLLLV